MYGLVNRGVQDLVVANFGADAWKAICADADVDPEGFIAMQAYDDAITYRLVGAASKYTGLSAEAVLETFGAYWVQYTAKEGYGHLMTAAGKTLPEFLSNLDAMHSRINATFPELAPPSFQVEIESEHRLRLHYWSHRAGLAPLVVGLIKGLGAMLKTEVTIRLDSSRETGNDHEEFVIDHS